MSVASLRRSLEGGTSRCSHGWRIVELNVGGPLQPLLAFQPGAVSPPISTTSLYEPPRPNTGLPQVRRSSLVCSGPLMRSQSGNVMLTLSLHQSSFSRSVRYLTQLLRAYCCSDEDSKVSGSSAS